MKNKIILTTLVSALAASSLMAQDDSRPRRPGPGPDGQGEGGARFHHRMMMPPPLIETLDANKDGTISSDEIANASTALKSLDKNNDGQITGDELRTPRPESPGPGPDGERRGPRPDDKRKGPPPGERGLKPGGPGPDGAGSERERRGFHMPPPPVIAALDANHDKTISADEIANASTALKTLDKNGDGQLTKEELRPEPPPRPQQ